MSDAERELPKEWKWSKLKKIARISAGNSAPQGIKYFEQGTHPFIRTQDVGSLHIHSALCETVDRINNLAINEKNLTLQPEKSLLIPKSGVSTFLNHRVLTAIPAYVSSHLAIIVAKSCVLPEYLYYWSLTLDARRLTPDNNYPSLRLSDLEEVELPLPPLPVQERIVQILQKADEIRRKRQEAVAIADAILPAIFIDMFGDPGTNPKKFPIKPLRELCTPTSGGTPSKKNSAFWTNGTIPWVSPKDMKVPEIMDVPDKITEEAIGNRAKTQLGTVLIVVRGMILQHSVPVCLVQSPLTFNQDIKGLLPHKDIPSEFLFWALRCSKQRLLEMVGTASHGTKKIDTERLMGLSLFKAEAKTMEYFASIHRHFFETQDKRLNAVIESQKTCEALLTRAFTGELTAVWEATNAEQIAAKQALHDRLPQLVVLTFLKEKIRRTQHPNAEANVLVTALMKYAFLFQMEGIAKRRLYQFVPYHYGPFAKELYADLETLQEQGLITVDNGDEDKTQIAIANPQAAESAIALLPDELKEDIAAILDAYGELDHNTLLATVYEKYPAYAKKSRLQKRRGVSSNDQEE